MVVMGAGFGFEWRSREREGPENLVSGEIRSRRGDLRW